MNSRRIGDLLGAFFDEKTLQKAGSYSKLFSSWTEMTKNCGLAAAADHSRIADLERGILLVEADHPGWIQLLQTKERELLKGVRSLFKELEIRGISFRLMRSGQNTSEFAKPAVESAVTRPPAQPAAETPGVQDTEPTDIQDTSVVQTVEPMNQEGFDEHFKESLQRLKKSLEERNL
jgi:hypothetical protein